MLLKFLICLIFFLILDKIIINRPRKITLKYQDFGKYNNPSINERKAELPIAFWFLKNFDKKEIIEIGEITPMYEEVSHLVFDLKPIKSSTIKNDAININYKNKNVLSISTVEHIGFGDYGLPKDNNLSINVIKKIIKESKTHLITFPVGYNRNLENQIFNSKINYYFIKRDKLNNWFYIQEKDFCLFDYGKPFEFGNVVCIITNLNIIFEFEKK